MVTVTSSGQFEKVLAALAPRTKKRGKTEEKLHRNRKQEATQAGSVIRIPTIGNTCTDG